MDVDFCLGACFMLRRATGLQFDDAYFKAHTAAGRKPGEPNPFEVGTDGVARYFGVVQACTTGVKIRAVGQ